MLDTLYVLPYSHGMNTTRTLPPRELEVLERIADGLTNRAIAEALGLSVRTVEDRVGRLYARIGVDNRVAAARWYMANEAA